MWVLQDEAAKEFGEGVDIPLFSMDTFDLFRDNLDTVFGWIDLLWVGLAVISAWRSSPARGAGAGTTDHEPPPEEPAKPS